MARQKFLKKRPARRRLLEVFGSLPRVQNTHRRQLARTNGRNRGKQSRPPMPYQMLAS